MRSIGVPELLILLPLVLAGPILAVVLLIKFFGLCRDVREIKEILLRTSARPPG